MESKATANLKRNAAKTAEQMRRLVAQAVREAKAAIDAGLKAKAALTAAGRAPIEAQIDVAFRQKLQAKLQEALDALSSKSADSGNEEAIRQARDKGEIIPRFSTEYLQEYLARISPKNAPAIAAVFTSSMSASAKEALRLAAVDTFRAAAATGLTTRERMKLLQENWAQRAQDTNPFRFVDRAGRRWENARYVQMLARTTAQRVQTAAFCDSMLQGGYPLARISNDSGNKDCGVCSAWEGRLIDLTAGNEFRKYGAVPLRAAREAGVFHPNCTHRLEYLSPTEYPEGAWDEFADRVGEPGAFGDPLKTNAGLESAAAAKRRAEAAAKAAEERAKKEAEEAARREQEAWEALRLALDRGTDTLGKPLGGSTGARLIEVNGKKYVLKGGATEEHLVSEQAADEAYRAAGIRVPPQRTLIAPGGRRYKVAELIEGQELAAWWAKASKAEQDAMRDKLIAGLDVDAMLGNWDVIGMAADNILVDKDGNPWRIDNGGSLSFRAQGARKADADWKDGWPNELFTIADSPNNAPYVGGATPLRLIRQAAKRDWQAIIDALPDQADKDALTKRVAEMRQLAARDEDFTKGGYAEAFTERVIRHSFDLSKEGFREEVPKTVKHGDYGFCRSPKSTAGLVGGQPGEQYGQLALAAIKTVATHAKDHNYTLATLNAFYAKEAELKDILKKDPNNAGAKHYLAVMAQVKDAVKNHTVLPQTDTSIKVHQPKQPQQPATKYTSLTDHIAQYMAAHGGDYQFIKRWGADQAGDSWNDYACRVKIVELESRGLDWKKKTAPGVFFGVNSQARRFDSAADFYTNNPAQLARDLESFAQYKSAIQLLLENADLAIEGKNGGEVLANDKTTRTLRLLRTEGPNVIPSGTKTGDDAAYSIGSNESFTLAKVFKFKGKDGVIVEVPFSRVNGLYCLERTPGGGRYDNFFAGEGENEVNAATDGLRRVFIKNPGVGKSNATWYHLLQKKGTP